MKKGKILVLFVGLLAALSFVFITLSTNAMAAGKASNNIYKKNGRVVPMVRVLRKTTGYPIKKIYDPNTNQGKHGIPMQKVLSK